MLASPSAGAPIPPPCDLKIQSKVKQAGATSGGAAVTTTGSTGGSGKVTCVVAKPGEAVKKVAVGNSGVSGVGASAADGAFANLVKAVTG